jgi:tetratricopeptide (TPR) repeat protein
LALHLFKEGLGALLAALIFALHPLFSETVNYISARSSSLATLFYLWAFYSFLKPRDAASGKDQPIVFHLSLFSLFTVLAFLSKEISFTLPIMLLIYDLLFTRFDKTKKRVWALPYLLLVFLMAVLVLKINLIQYFKDIYLTYDSIKTYIPSILAQVKGLVVMIGLFIFPIGLSIDHDLTRPVSILDLSVIGALSILVGILVTAFLIRRSHKVVAFFLVWPVITSLPTTLIPLNVPLMEHRGYLPGVGLVMGMGWAMGKIIGGRRSAARRAALAACMLIFVLYAGMTLHRNTLWKDQVTLWSDAVAKAPGSDRAWTHLGLAHLSHQDHQQALEAFEKALLLNPDAVVARVGMGSSYHLQGRLDEAIQFYQDAIFLYPGYFLSHFNLGVTYQQQGLFEKALNAYKEALKINAYHPETHLNLGSVYLALYKQDLAILEYQEALRLNPELADAHYNLGVVYEAMGRVELAAPHYREAERLGKGDK